MTSDRMRKVHIQNATGTFHRSHDLGGHVWLVGSIAPNTQVRQAAAQAFTWVAKTLRESELEVIQERIFGTLDVESLVLEQRARALTEQGLAPSDAFTYIEGRPCWGTGLAGLIIHAVQKESLFTAENNIEYRGRLIGKKYQREGLTYLILQNISDNQDDKDHINPASQVSKVIMQADEYLRTHGANFSHVARTWFYLDGILDWYDEFNRVRSTTFQDIGLEPFPPNGGVQLPASTGIEGRTGRGGSCSLDLLAILANKDQAPPFRMLKSPTQREPAHYGSAFSRGVAVDLADSILIQVSGTAAIDEAGRSLYVNDVRGQIERTLDTVELLIAQEGARLSDICAATAFLKRPEDAATLSTVLDVRGFGKMPMVCVVADICRDELLFELDGEVTVTRRIP